MTEEEKRYIIEKHRTDLDQEDIVSDTHDLLLVARTIQPISLWNSRLNRLEGNRVNLDTDLYTQTQALTSTSPMTFTVPTGETWVLMGILAILVADANVADRDLTVDVTTGTISTLQAQLLGTTAVRATAAQTVAQYLSAGHTPNFWQNDNGTITVVADENPLPLYITAAGTIDLTYTNDQAGDVLEGQIWYHKANITEE